ncbi:U6 snRNA-associated Sm-like protein LSm1 isoform X2 [Bemisia tabaci]|uniref:U6 snRNA-associated Sm-like protein LSm1 isoform X2 n=1 Tax=Bemisia tabaci TaxID=7038 RepID=UPI0008F99626|nr:PREDICTED: U6 snRNA-associated Sm-like protein LSm1 isoform X2 [Bemisia tabaci]
MSTENSKSFTPSRIFKSRRDSHDDLPIEGWPMGTATLLTEIDKKMMVVLRDNRTLIGYLRSIDQFGNLALHQTIERIYVGSKYGDIPRGIFIVRGENAVLLGELDQTRDVGLIEQVSVEEILNAQRREQEAKQEKNKVLAKALRERGLSFVNDLVQEDQF